MIEYRVGEKRILTDHASLLSALALSFEGVGLFGPSLGLTPPRLRAPGPACGCPNLFRTNLSNRVGSSAHPRHQKRKTAHWGPFFVSGGEGGIRTHGAL